MNRRFPRLALCLSLALLGLAGFSLSLLVGPGSSPAAAQNRSGPPPSACGAVITETVGLDVVPDCETTQVTVTVQVTRPKPLPLHVVFVIGRHLLMYDHLDEAKNAARDAVNALEFTGETKVGVVSLSVQERVEQPLTNEKGSVISAISRIRLDDVSFEARYYDWLETAEQLLMEERSEAISPIEIIVLMSTGCPNGYESYCNRLKGSASRVQGTGITMIGICKPGAEIPDLVLPSDHCRDIQSMSSTGSYYEMRQASRINRRLTELEDDGKTVQPEEAVLMEYLAPGFSYVPGSGQPAPLVRPDWLEWKWDGLQAGDVVTVSYEAKPEAMGMQPLRLEDSRFIVTDNLDRVSLPYHVPTRTLEVVPCAPPTDTPAPTPEEPPTATSTPPPTETPVPPTATTTNTPEPTPAPEAIFMPLLMRNLCKVAERHTDVVLVLDASTSMLTEEGGQTRLRAAQDAASGFVDLLDLAGGDQAAVVSFNREAQVLSGLSGDRDVLVSSIEAIATEQGTRIDRALETAGSILQGSERQADRIPAIVLLTDGNPDGGTEPEAVAAARRAIDAGATVYAVGIGEDLSRDFLIQIVSRPETLIIAPDAADLAAIYAEIAGELPCPGGVVWQP